MFLPMLDTPLVVVFWLQGSSSSLAGLIPLIFLIAFVLTVVYIIRKKPMGGKLNDAFSLSPKEPLFKTKEQRNIAGGILLVIGIIAALYGFVRLNSLSSQAMEAMGGADTTAFNAIVLGAIAAIAGVVLLAKKPPTS